MSRPAITTEMIVAATKASNIMYQPNAQPLAQASSKGDILNGPLPTCDFSLINLYYFS